MKFLVIIALALVASPVEAQSPCPSCGRVHSSVVSSAGAGGVEDVVSLLNRQRALRGVGPLARDPVLQAVAARRVTLMARSNLRTHPRGSFSPGTFEGVGWNSSRNPTAVNACGTYTQHGRCGAAMIRTGNGSFFAVVYRR